MHVLLGERERERERQRGALAFCIKRNRTWFISIFYEKIEERGGRALSFPNTTQRDIEKISHLFEREILHSEEKLGHFQTKEEFFHVPSLIMINKMDDIDSCPFFCCFIKGSSCFLYRTSFVSMRRLEELFGNA